MKGATALSDSLAATRGEDGARHFHTAFHILFAIDVEGDNVPKKDFTPPGWGEYEPGISFRRW